MDPRGRRSPIAALLLALGSAVLFLDHVNAFWFITDDAFISFRYARHLATGEGLVWNPGERVEGYTNFLWVALLAGGIRAGIEPEILSRVLGVASGVGVLLVLAAFSARRLGWSDPFVWLPVLALAASRSFTAWCSGGLATQAFSLLVLTATTRFVAERERGARAAVASSSLYAAATLLRPEGALFTAVAGVFLTSDVVRRRRSLRALLVWCLPWLALVGAHVAFRLSYYGAWLPNTFHAKVTGLWLEQAGRYFGLFHEDYAIGWFLPWVVVAVAGWRRFEHALLAALVAAQVSYLAAIGGDRFEFRFLVVALPPLYWLIAEGLRWLASRGRSDPQRARVCAAGAFAGGAALVLATWLGSHRPEAREVRADVESIQATRAYTEERVRDGRLLAHAIERGELPSDLVLAVGGAGAIPYYTMWPTVDYRGLNDPNVRRFPLSPRRMIAHERFSPPGYLRERGVVVFDVRNDLVVEEDPWRFAGTSAELDGVSWPLHAVRFGGGTMVFATTLSRQELARSFPAAQLLF